MSRGPGRVQRAIITALNTPDGQNPLPEGHDFNSPGPIGVPVIAIFQAVYNTTNPTRAQKVSVARAISVMEQRGIIETFNRRVCEQHQKVAPAKPWDEAARRTVGECTCWQHIPRQAIGRPRTDEEQAESKQQFARAMAIVRSFS